MNHSTYWTIPVDHPAFAGHFIDMPILPGVVLLDMVIAMMADDKLINLNHYKISSVKFLSPAKPGERLIFEYNLSDKGLINFTILSNNRKIAAGSLISGCVA